MVELDARWITARNVLLIVVGFLAVIWIVQFINVADHYRLSYDYAIQPRIVADLPYVLTAPFLHWSWSHIEGNSVPLVVLGFLAAYRSIPKFIGVTAVVILTSGLAAWLVDSTGSYSAGASGVIFGWFGYVMMRGIFSHDKLDILVALAAMIYYLPLFTLLLPAPHLGYQDHIGGLVGGVLCGWLFRSQPAAGDAAIRTGSGPGRPQDVAAPARGAPPPTTQIDDDLAALRQEIVADHRGPDVPTEN